MASSPPPLKSTCHCGAVSITLPHRPSEINECQCTICRRYAAAWAYYEPKDVQISIAEDTPTKFYVWGDKDLEFHFCSVCGCVTHWKSIEESGKMGVNTRNMEPEELRMVSRRISFGILGARLRCKDERHPEDKAEY